MATYTELQTARENGGLQQRCAVAGMIKAHAILQELTPSADRLQWASAALAVPEAQSAQLLNAVLAANESATLTQILNATDTVLQNAVNAAVDKLHP